MIIDSHAHYNNNAYKKPFRYLSYDKDGYSLKEGELPQLMQEMDDADIRYFIEPGVSLQSCEEVLQLCVEYPGRIFPAIGVHPTRSIFEKWSDRHKLAAYANTPGVIAIGEIGLDYHYKREEQHRLKQHLWFIYQLNLAWKMKMPVILHVRDAHEDALRILSWHPARKLGGDPVFLWFQRNRRAVSEVRIPFRYWRLCAPVGGTGEGFVGSDSPYSVGPNSGRDRCTFHPALL